MNKLLKWFEYKHLPPSLRETSKMFHDLAHWVNQELPEGAEKTAGLRKLLEAKDCIVRAKKEEVDDNAASNATG